MKRISICAWLIVVAVLSFAQLPEGEIAITASSTLPSSKTSNFNPESIYDGSISSWCEGVEGNGIGEYFQVDFRYPDVMEYIMIKNGFGNEKYWAANGRIKKMKVTNGDGESRFLILADTPDLQVVGLNVIKENENMLFETSVSLAGNSFTFEILEVYPGVRWQDVCLCEMNFNQWYTENFPMKEEYIYKNLYKIFLEGIFDQSGALYVESDWDGYVETNTETGYIHNEIVSGDGTTGFDDYQVFINGMTGQYYLFHSSFLSYPSEAGMEGKLDNEGNPESIQKFAWKFYLFDPKTEEFMLVDDQGLEELFIVTPAKLYSEKTGASLSNKDIWLTIEEPGIIKVSYPSRNTDIEVYFAWDGNWFRVKD